MMSSIDLSATLSRMSALDTLKSRRNTATQSDRQQMRTFPGKENNATASDAFSLTLRSKPRGQSQALAAKMWSISDTGNLIGLTESGLNRIANLLIKMRNQTEQATRNSVDPVERQAIQAGVSQSIHEFEKVIDETPWMEVRLLDELIETFGETSTIRAGAEENESISLALQKAHLSRAGSKESNLESKPNAGGNESDEPARRDIAEEMRYFSSVGYFQIADFQVPVDSAENAAESTVKIDGLLDEIKEKLRVVHAFKHHPAFKKGALLLGQTKSGLRYYRIMDGDMARAQLGTTKLQIFQMTPIAIATQANQAPGAVLSLFH